jgi:thiol-disulfide isomerase/thioredoxin
MNYLKENKGTIALVVLAIIAYAIYYIHYRIPATLEFDSLVVESSQGVTSTLGAERNGAEVVHFYAHWCGPCIREMRSIAQHHEKWEEANIEFVFLTDDNWEQINQMRLLLPPGIKILKIESLNDIGVRTIPTTYIINSKNQEVFHKVDACQWQDDLFLQEIKKLLALN